MTVESTAAIIRYSGNDALLIFAYTWKILDDDDIEVYLRTVATGAEVLKTKDTHYTVSDVGKDAGGNITFIAAPATGEQVVLKRKPAVTQTSDYQEGDEFAEEAHEDALDRQAMISQMLNETLERALVLAETSNFSGLTLPDPVSGTVLGWTGTDLVNQTLTSTDLLSPVKDISEYADFETAIATIGANQITLRISVDTAVSEDTTTPENVILWLPVIGATLNVATTKTLTIYSPENIICGNRQQIFSLAGTGAVAFTVGGTVHLSWLASGAGTTASPYTDFESLFSVTVSHAYKMCAGHWKSTVGITTFTGDNITITGAGRGITNWYFTAVDASTFLDFDATNTHIDNLHIRDISFFGSDPSAPTTGVATGACLDLVRVVHSTFKNIEILYFNAGVVGGTSKGIKIMGDGDGNVYGLYFENIYMYKTSIGFCFEDDGTSEYNADLINIHNFWFGAQDITNDTYGIKIDGYLTNLSLTGTNVIYHCKYGVYFNTTSGAAGLVNLSFDNVKFEASVAYTGTAAVFLKGDGEPGVGDYLRNINFNGCHWTANWTTQIDLDYAYNVSIRDAHLLSLGTSIAATVHVDLELSNVWHSGTLTIAAQKMQSIEIASHILHAIYLSDRNSDWRNKFADNPTVSLAKGEPSSGNETLEVALLLGGLVDEDPEGSVNWTLDTAENIVAAIPGATIGDTFECILHNDATPASAEVVTIVAGAGVTLKGSTVTLTEGTNETAKLVFRLTNVTAASEAVDCYILTGI